MSGERLRRGGDEDLAVLREKREALFRLRATWLMEFDEALRTAPDPDTYSRFKPSSWGRKRREKKLQVHLMDRSDRLPLTKLALLMDRCLAQATDTLPDLLESTLPQEGRMSEASAARFRAESTKFRRILRIDGVDSVAAALTGLIEIAGACTSTNTWVRELPAG